MAIFLKILLKNVLVIFVSLTTINGVLITTNQHVNATNNVYQTPNASNYIHHNSNATNNFHQNFNVTDNLNYHLNNSNKFHQNSNFTNNFHQNLNVTTNFHQNSNVTNNFHQNSNVTNNTQLSSASNFIQSSIVTNNFARFANVSNNVTHHANITNNETHHANGSNNMIHHANVTNNNIQTPNVATNVTQPVNNVIQHLNAGNSVLQSNNQHANNANLHLNVASSANPNLNVTSSANLHAYAMNNVQKNVTDNAHQNFSTPSFVEQHLNVLYSVNQQSETASNASASIVTVPTATREINVTKDLINILVRNETVAQHSNSHSNNKSEIAQNLSVKQILTATLLNTSSLNEAASDTLPEVPIASNQSSLFASFVETTTPINPASVAKQEMLLTFKSTTAKPTEATPSTTKTPVTSPAKTRKPGRPSLIQRLMMNSRTMAPGSNAGGSATTPEVMYDDGLLQMFDIGEVPVIPTTTKVPMPSFYDATPPEWLVQQMANNSGGGRSPRIYEITFPPLESDNSRNVGKEDNEELVDNVSESNPHGIPVEATNSIIISAIIGGCAIVFFSLLMALCIWRQNKSRRPNYPPNSTMLPTTSLTSINSQKPVGLFQRI